MGRFRNRSVSEYERRRPNDRLHLFGEDSGEAAAPEVAPTAQEPYQEAPARTSLDKFRAGITPVSYTARRSYEGPTTSSPVPGMIDLNITGEHVPQAVVAGMLASALRAVTEITVQTTQNPTQIVAIPNPSETRPAPGGEATPNSRNKKRKWGKKTVALAVVGTTLVVGGGVAYATGWGQDMISSFSDDEADNNEAAANQQEVSTEEEQTKELRTLENIEIARTSGTITALTQWDFTPTTYEEFLGFESSDMQLTVKPEVIWTVTIPYTPEDEANSAIKKLPDSGTTITRYEVDLSKVTLTAKVDPASYQEVLDNPSAIKFFTYDFTDPAIQEGIIAGGMLPDIATTLTIVDTYTEHKEAAILQAVNQWEQQAATGEYANEFLGRIKQLIIQEYGLGDSTESSVTWVGALPAPNAASTAEKPAMTAVRLTDDETPITVEFLESNEG